MSTLLTSVEAQLQRGLSFSSPLESIEFSVREARNSVLAQDAHAVVPVPSTAVSSVAGYAISPAAAQRAEDAAVELEVVEHLTVGLTSDTQLDASTAIAVVPGCVVPASADRVVPGTLDPSTERVTIAAGGKVGDGIDPAGSVMTTGAAVLPRGTLLHDREIAALTAAGCARIRVHPRPRLVVVTVGDDLCDIGREVSEGLRPDAVCTLLTTAGKQACAEAYRGGPVPQQVPAVASTIQDQLVRADLIVIAVPLVNADGELSESLQEALAAADCRDLEYCSIDPGGLVGVGVVGEDSIPVVVVDPTVLGSFVAFEIFVRPMLMERAGRSRLFRPVITAALRGSVASMSGVRSFVPALAQLVDGQVQVTPIAESHATAMFWLYQANALMIVPEQTELLTDGDEVAIIRLDRE